jgi:hypothetical protein
MTSSWATDSGKGVQRPTSKAVRTGAVTGTPCMLSTSAAGGR